METDNIVRRALLNMRSAISSLSFNKDKKTVIVGAWFGEKFADNSRFLFQFLSENKSKLGLEHVIWVTADEQLASELREYNYETVVMGSEESKKWHKRAYYHIICNASSKQVLHDKNGYVHIINGDIETELSFRARRINLWHGTGGLKAVSMATNAYKRLRDIHPVQYTIKEFLLFHSKFYQLFSLYPGGWGRCYQITTSPLQTETLHYTWAKPEELCIETSYPRNCECPRLLKNEEELINMMGRYRATVLYLPTFRSNSSYEYQDLSEILQDDLRNNNILWIEKSHSAEKVYVSSDSIRPNVVKLNPNFDINVLIPHITILLTDYSSVRMDAMFHNKATLFYVPDYDEYLKGDNGFMADPKEVLCGPKYKEVEALREGIIKYSYDPEASKTGNYEMIRDRYWSKHRTLEEIWADIVSAVG